MRLAGVINILRWDLLCLVYVCWVSMFSNISLKEGAIGKCERGKFHCCVLFITASIVRRWCANSSVRGMGLMAYSRTVMQNKVPNIGVFSCKLIILALIFMVFSWNLDNSVISIAGF